MQYRAVRLLGLAAFVLIGATPSIMSRQAQRAVGPWSPTIPKTWDDEALKDLEVPLVLLGASPVHVSTEYYYRIPVRPIYRSYPVYAPGKEPPGYLEWLKRQEPEIVFDAARLKTEADWRRAGEIVFDAPTLRDAYPVEMVRDPAFYEKTATPVAADATVPFLRYWIQEKGKVEVAAFSCATCHTRVMPDGTVIKGAQGNFPLGRVDAFWLRQQVARAADDQARQGLLAMMRGFTRSLYYAPGLDPDLMGRLDKMSLEDFFAAGERSGDGIMSRHGTSPWHPVQIPDLIGVKERRYLDRTGLQRHRSLVDLMRYGALNQGADLLSRYGAFVPLGDEAGRLPDPATQARYSDEQLYALALYLYSLEPPPKPNRFDAQARRGQKVFHREGCAMCHTPPLYTNNKLTSAEGFTVPEGHSRMYDILPVSVGTDPYLTLKTRRGTGYYKVPSLLGVWYRGPFEHSGSVATLEDWFDPRRLRDDYVPTGMRGPGIKARAVPGHRFGLSLSSQDRRALIAFLKTL